MDGEARGSQRNLVRTIVGRRSKARCSLRQAGEERRDGVDVDGTDRPVFERAQELWPGGPGGAPVRLRSVHELREVAAQHERIDRLHPKGLRGSGTQSG
jgi:hypothetical protein